MPGVKFFLIFFKKGIAIAAEVCYNNVCCGGVAQLVRAYGSHP